MARQQGRVDDARLARHDRQGEGAETLATLNIPNWYELVLLVLAAFRTYRLLAEDTILDRPRAWVLGLTGWEEGKPVPHGYKEKLATFITCPWCAGFWISVLWWVAWLLTPTWTLYLSVPWVISALLALAAKNLDEEA